MTQFYHNSPARSDAMHIDNQLPSIAMYREMRMCANTKCQKKTMQSIGQFFDKRRNPTKTFCKSCRGEK